MKRATLIAWTGVWFCLAAAACRGRAAVAPQTFDSAGVPISYTVEGSGPPVVLIHGLYSSADINWRLPGTIRELAGSYRVIAFDLRGHGRSGKPAEEAAYGVQMEEDVLRLLDHLHIPKAHIAGYSLGGMVAMKFITRHPNRVISAVLGGMGFFREDSPLQALWGNIRARAALGTPAVCLQSLGQLAVSETEVKAVRAPVAVLIGDRDPVRALYVAPLMRVRPDWPVTVIDGAGHLNCIAKPQFRDALKSWLDEHR